MSKSSLCDYIDAYILVSGTMTVAALAAGGGNVSRQVVFKNWAPVTDCISEMNNTQINNAKDINVVVPIYNLVEYGDNYSKTKSSWQYYRDEPVLTDSGTLADFFGNSASFKFK